MATKKLKKPKWYSGMYSLVSASEDEIKEYFAWVDSLPPPPPVFENNRYTFKSRYNEERYFELQNGEWFFGGEQLDLCFRIGYKKDQSDPEYIDPSGGPFLSRGSKFKNHVSVLPEHDLEISGFEKVDNRWKILTIARQN
jgi:hypothetical protein